MISLNQPKASVPTRAVASTRKNFLRGAVYFLLAFGLIDLGYAGFVYADAHTYQAAAMKEFEHPGSLSEPRLLKKDDVIGELQVPRLGLAVMVVEGDSFKNLRRAVAHLSKSPLPGELGNVALAGHRDTFFRPLRNILLGDQITIKTPERSFDYIVESIEIVSPTDTQVLDPTVGHDLTLLTCYPFYYVGPSPKRFVVRARQVDPTLEDQNAAK
jgi:LPXTG-site transpeptidase (sortase) family protein